MGAAGDLFRETLPLVVRERADLDPLEHEDDEYDEEEDEEEDDEHEDEEEEDKVA